MRVGGTTFILQLVVFAAFSTAAAQSPVPIDVPIIVTDTLGNRIKSFHVTVSYEDDSGTVKFESPLTLRLSPGRAVIRLSASLHRPSEFTVEVSPELTVLMVALVRPTASEITGDSNLRNPTVRISVGAAAEQLGPRVVRIIGIYLSYRQDFLLNDPRGELEVRDLPFGKYLVLVFAQAKVIGQFTLTNEDFNRPRLDPVGAGAHGQ